MFMIASNKKDAKQDLFDFFKFYFICVSLKFILTHIYKLFLIQNVHLFKHLDHHWIGTI